jgi:hypothetical protein
LKRRLGRPIGLNAQTKLQYDAMVYLCLSNVLLIFEHDQSHVMIVNGHQTLRSTLFSLFTHLDITAPDNVRWCRLDSGEQATLGKNLVAYGYNSPDSPVVHRTVR